MRGRVQRVVQEQSDSIRGDIRALEGRKDNKRPDLCAEVRRGRVDIPQAPARVPAAPSPLSPLPAGGRVFVEDGEQDTSSFFVEVFLKHIFVGLQVRERSPGDALVQLGMAFRRGKERMSVDRRL